MTMQEFVLYQERTFEAYCNALIRNEGKDARKEIVRRAKREINLSMLDPTTQVSVGNQDTYDLGAMTFLVHGIPVKVSDPILGRALASLTPYRRSVILMFYFMDRTDPQIGALLRRDPTTVNYQRRRALKRLKEALEGLGYEA